MSGINVDNNKHLQQDTEMICPALIIGKLSLGCRQRVLCKHSHMFEIGGPGTTLEFRITCLAIQ